MKELTGVRPLAIVVPISRALAVQEGIVKPTPAERVAARLHRSSVAREAAERTARRNLWIIHAKLATGDVGAALLDLHAPEDGDLIVPDCTGCECECDTEPWPCASVLVLAKAAGLEPPPGV
jgi:hypothetical protein